MRRNWAVQESPAEASGSPRAASALSAVGTFGRAGRAASGVEALATGALKLARSRGAFWVAASLGDCRPQSLSGFAGCDRSFHGAGAPARDEPDVGADRPPPDRTVDPAKGGASPPAAFESSAPLAWLRALNA